MATEMVWSVVDASLRDVIGDIWGMHGGIISFALGKQGRWLHLGLWVPNKGGAINLYSYERAEEALSYIGDSFDKGEVWDEQNIVSRLQYMRATFGTEKGRKA